MTRKQEELSSHWIGTGWLIYTYVSIETHIKALSVLTNKKDGIQI